MEKGKDGVKPMKRAGLIITILLIALIVTSIFLFMNPANQQEKEKDTRDTDEKTEKLDERQIVTKETQEGNELKFTLKETESQASTSRNYIYTVSNEGNKTVTLSFSTSQRYDYELRNKGKVLITRFSHGRAFMQVIGETKLAPGESVSYDIALRNLEPGDYELTVYLVAKGVEESATVTEFTVIE